MNVIMCDKFLCKWGSGLAHDTYMSNNYQIYNSKLKLKNKTKEKMHNEIKQKG
jgi:hypothetical protein